MRKNLPGFFARNSGLVSILMWPSIRCAMVDLVMMRSISCIFSSSNSSARSDIVLALGCSFMGSPFVFRARLRDRFYRIDDGLIAGAAAVVAGEMLADVVAARHDFCFFCSFQ